METGNKLQLKKMDGLNKYHGEIFQEVEEHPDEVLADIEGSVPRWIAGTFLKTGPGRYEWNDTSYNHWFEGDAILFRFHVANGNVMFSSKFLESHSFLESKMKNRIARSNFATHIFPDPCKNIFSRYMSYYFEDEKETDNCNVALVKVKDDIYASADIPRMWRVDEKSLQAISPINIMDSLPGMWLCVVFAHCSMNELFLNDIPSLKYILM